MANAYDAKDMERLADEAKAKSPIAVINEILRYSNIPIKISIRANEKIMASRDGSPEYSAAELSDGERNALLISGNVLTVPEQTLLIIDEPERHLHRSIISPLLSELFERRTDCSFIISTHDPNLPLADPDARVLLLRSCEFDGQGFQIWEADMLPSCNSVDEKLKSDILGSRRKIIFVEGTESSLDKALYSLLFPNVSVIPKGSSLEVERAVKGLRAVEAFHWLEVYGIIDGDGLDTNQLSAKENHGIYALPYYSIEAIYFNSKIIEKIALRQASIIGDDGEELKIKAINSGIAGIKDHTNHLSKNVAKRAVRRSIYEQIPNDNKLLEGHNIQIQNNSSKIHAKKQKDLDTAVSNGNWEKILKICPIRESSSLDNISKELKFRNKGLYIRAVRQLLIEDLDALKFIQSLFGNLTSTFQKSHYMFKNRLAVTKKSDV